MSACRFFLGHRMAQGSNGNYLYTGCARGRRLESYEQLPSTLRCKQASGDIEHWMADNAPEGFSFVDCNWKKRKAKFVSPQGHLQFVAF